MNKFKVGDVVWLSSQGKKLRVRRIDWLKTRPYFCTNNYLIVENWGYYKESELKPIKREYAILG
jgi:hypothetical protein